MLAKYRNASSQQSKTKQWCLFWNQTLILVSAFSNAAVRASGRRGREGVRVTRTNERKAATNSCLLGIETEIPCWEWDGRWVDQGLKFYLVSFVCMDARASCLRVFLEVLKRSFMAMRFSPFWQRDGGPERLSALYGMVISDSTSYFYILPYVQCPKHNAISHPAWSSRRCAALAINDSVYRLRVRDRFAQNSRHACHHLQPSTNPRLAL